MMGPYTVRLAVYGPPGEARELCVTTDELAAMRDPVQRQELLGRIAAHLADRLGREMFPTYRPSATEQLHAQYMRSRGGRK